MKNQEYPLFEVAAALAEAAWEESFHENYLALSKLPLGELSLWAQQLMEYFATHSEDDENLDGAEFDEFCAQDEVFRRFCRLVLAEVVGVAFETGNAFDMLDSLSCRQLGDLSEMARAQYFDEIYAAAALATPG